jgi:hypothetical protein
MSNTNKIYKMTCGDLPCYIGSTSRGLNYRLYEHIYDINHNIGKNKQVYKDNLDDLKMEILEDGVDGNELKQKERWYIENIPNNINHNLPSRTKKEYDKLYYKLNRDVILEKKKNKNKMKKLDKEKIEIVDEDKPVIKVAKLLVDFLKSNNLELTELK